MELPKEVTEALTTFTTEAERVFGERLVGVVLYGSAAEGRLRPTSDINVVVISRSYTQSDAAGMASTLSFLSAAIELHAMFLLEQEVATAIEVFAVKFLDISRRRIVLYGTDPFVGITVSTSQLVAQLRQVLLNLVLRLRYSMAVHGENGDALALQLADGIAPLRTAANALLTVRGRPSASPKQALEEIAAEVRADGFTQTLEAISQIREGHGGRSVEILRAMLADVIDLTSATQNLVEAEAS